MSASVRIDDGLWAALAEHQAFVPRTEPDDVSCSACGSDWPCDAARARDALEAAETQTTDMVPKDWHGLITILDEAYPASVFPTLPDDEFRGQGPRLASALRRLRDAEVARQSWVDEQTDLSETITALAQERDALQAQKDAALAALDGPDWAAQRAHKARAALTDPPKEGKQGQPTTRRSAPRANQTSSTTGRAPDAGSSTHREIDPSPGRESRPDPGEGLS